MATRVREERKRSSRRAQDESHDERVKSDAERTAKHEELAAEIDEVLDAIDEVLETNAEEFVKAYVQKGGE